MSRRRNNRNKKNRIRNKKRVLSREERNRIQKNRKKHTRLNYKRFTIFIILFIIIVIGIIYGIGKLFGLKNNKEVDKKEEKIVSVDKKKEETKEENIDTIKVIESMNKDIEKKYLNLEKKVVDYINSNNLKKDNVKVGFSNLNSNHVYKHTNNKDIAMRNSNLFIISMIAEDLERENIIDLNKKIDLDNKNDNRQEEALDDEENITDNSYTLGDLIEEMIINPKTDIVDKVIDEIEFKSKSDWMTYANKKYNINIKTKNEMSLEDVINIMNILVEKKDNRFIYEKTINTLVKSASKNNDIYYLENDNFMGFVGEYKYGYTMDLGFIFGENPYIYIIQTDYSDKNINRDIRNILYNWNKSYN